MASEPEVTVIRRLAFDAPHPSGRHESHSYVLEVSVTGPLDPDTGYVIDFAVLKAMMRESVARLDLPVPAETVVLACWRDLAPRGARHSRIPKASTLSSRSTSRAPCSPRISSRKTASKSRARK